MWQSCRGFGAFRDRSSGLWSSLTEESSACFRGQRSEVVGGLVRRRQRTRKPLLVLFLWWRDKRGTLDDAKQDNRSSFTLRERAHISHLRSDSGPVVRLPPWASSVYRPAWTAPSDCSRPSSAATEISSKGAPSL